MLSGRHRFHGRNSLRQVYQGGKTVRGQQLNLKFSRRDPGRPFRVAVVVSKQVSRSAVTRNRIRRRIYEAVRQTEPQIPAGYDLVFTAFSDHFAALPPARLVQSVQALLKQALH